MDAVPAEVIQIMGRMGIKGVSRVRAKVLDGRDRGKILTRNVVGPVKRGDVIMIKETSMDSVGGFGER
jgi:small subunit ribosomal protein S28e